MRRRPYDTQFLPWNDPIDLILSYVGKTEAPSILKPKDSGISRIGINTSLFYNNTQNSTSDSFSAILSPASVKEVQQLTETYVQALAEVFGKASNDPSQTN